MRERNISIPEIEFVLQNGFHNAKKDTKSDRNWKYAMDGQTKDERSLRICILFESEMFIVTVIDLEK